MKGIMHPHVSLFLIFIIFSSFIFSQSLIAQDSFSGDESIEPSKINNWSFGLMYAQSPVSTSARDLVISVKKGLSSQSALRAGVTVIGFFVNEIKTSSFSKYYYGWRGENSKEKFNGQDYSFAYIFYPFKNKKIQFYGGAGVIYSQYNEIFNQNVLSTDLQNNEVIESYTKAAESKTKEGGALGILGIEWFPSSNISIIGEYNISFVYGKSDVANFNKDDLGSIIEPYNRSVKFFEFRPRGLRVGLSVYL